MSILEANGAVACAECGKQARAVRDRLKAENESLRELVRDVVLLAGVDGCDVTEMRLHSHGGDWRTVWERMKELGVTDHD